MEKFVSFLQNILVFYPAHSSFFLFFFLLTKLFCFPTSSREKISRKMSSNFIQSFLSIISQMMENFFIPNLYFWHFFAFLATLPLLISSCFSQQKKSLSLFFFNFHFQVEWGWGTNNENINIDDRK